MNVVQTAITNRLARRIIGGSLAFFAGNIATTCRS
jgi:hypothetical protein